MMQHKGKFGPHHDMMFKKPEPDRRTEATNSRYYEKRSAKANENVRCWKSVAPMHDIIASDTFDKSRSRSKLRKMEAQRKANMLAHMETQNKIYNVLTPEQKSNITPILAASDVERPAQEGKMPAAAE